MATYTIAGAGTRSITPGTTALRLSVTTWPTTYGEGRATPINYYDLGLIRIGWAGSFWRTIAIDAADMAIALPQDATTLGYTLFGTASVEITEVMGYYPFAVPLSSLPDVDTSTPPTTGQVLAWDNTSQVWHPVTPSSGGGSSTPTRALRQKILNHKGNWVVSSTSFVTLDTTNLAIAISLAVGDVARVGLSGQGYFNGSGAAWHDFNVVQPTLGTTRINQNSAGGAASSQATNRTTFTLITAWVAAEAGSHNFQFVTKVNTANWQLCNATSGNDETNVYLWVEKISAAELSA